MWNLKTNTQVHSHREQIVLPQVRGRGVRNKILKNYNLLVPNRQSKRNGITRLEYLRMTTTYLKYSTITFFQTRKTHQVG